MTINGALLIIIKLQFNGDLGQRMATAFEEVLALVINRFV
jgi:hypothetical protein